MHGRMSTEIYCDVCDLYFETEAVSFITAKNTWVYLARSALCMHAPPTGGVS